MLKEQFTKEQRKLITEANKLLKESNNKRKPKNKIEYSLNGSTKISQVKKYNFKKRKGTI